MKKQIVRLWLFVFALLTILVTKAHAEFEDGVSVEYALPRDRDEGLLGIMMPREDIPDRIVYDQKRHPVMFIGCVYQTRKYGANPNSDFCEDTYAGVWRIGKYDFQFFRIDFGYPGSDRTSIIDRRVTIGIAVSWKFK